VVAWSDSASMYYSAVIPRVDDDRHAAIEDISYLLVISGLRYFY
jgi:hypothetical protein